jgi:hypothetical protein
MRDREPVSRRSARTPSVRTGEGTVQASASFRKRTIRRSARQRPTAHNRPNPRQPRRKQTRDRKPISRCSAGRRPTRAHSSERATALEEVDAQGRNPGTHIRQADAQPAPIRPNARQPRRKRMRAIVTRSVTVRQAGARTAPIRPNARQPRRKRMRAIVSRQGDARQADARLRPFCPNARRARGKSLRKVATRQGDPLLLRPPAKERRQFRQALRVRGGTGDAQPDLRRLRHRPGREA